MNGRPHSVEEARALSLVRGVCGACSEPWPQGANACACGASIAAFVSAPIISDLAATVEHLHAEVARLRRMIEHAAPWQVSDEPTDAEMQALRLRWAFGPEKYQADADALISAVMRDRKEKARLARDLTTQTARADGAEAEAGLWKRSAEAHRAEAVETQKSRDHWRDCEERQRAATDAAVAHAEELTRALTILRATVEGRTTPPTDAEIAAHDGSWLVQWSTTSCTFAGGIETIREMRGREWSPAIRWVPYRNGRPRVWPVVTEASDGR
jgi:hypothetical protein